MQMVSLSKKAPPIDMARHFTIPTGSEAGYALQTSLVLAE